MVKYNRATIVPKHGVRNLQAVVTVPIELRDLVGRKQIGITTGTNDEKIARQRLPDLEAKLYKKLDDANLASHPLAVVYKELIDVVLKGETPWDIEDLFDRNKRFLLEDDIRQRTAEEMGNARSAFDDFEVGAYAQTDYLKAEELLNRFVEEFRKVSEEKFAPKKRNKRFKDVADEYHSSPDFPNQVKREKTRDDYIGTCAKFLAWAGDVSLDNFEGHEGRQLAAQFADEMNSPNSMTVQRKRGETVAAGTINRMFAAIRGVLRYAYNQGYTEHRLWDDTQTIVTAKGAKRIKPRPFEPDEERALMSSPMPPRDRLLLQFVITTGARLDEIALLTWDQIKEAEVDGEQCWYFVLKEEIAPVKREASERVVPIHPTMMACLKPYWKNTPFKCKKEKNRLFDFAKGKDGKTTAASKAGMRQIRKLFSDKRLVNHSFRYSYVSRTEKIEDAMSPRMANYIQGFALEKSERAGYSTGYLVEQLYPAIKLIDFDFILPPKQIAKQSNKPYQMVSGWMGKKVDTGGGE